MSKKMRSAPEMCYFSDAENNAVELYVSVPGVTKDAVQIRAKKDGINLSAWTENMEYVAALAFGIPLNRAGVETKYDCGVLKIKVPFDGPVSGLSVTSTF